MAVNIGPRIGIEGEKKFRDEIKNINQELKTLGSEMKRAVSAFELGEDAEKSLADQKQILEKQIEKQRKGIEKLEEQLRKSADAFGENDSKTLQWARAVNDANTDLNKMQKQLKNVEAELEDVGKEATESAGSIDDLFSVDNMAKGLGVAAAVGGVKELGSALMGVVTETQEYRKIMASLEVSSQKAGYSAKETAAIYSQLYGVLGDQQTAATAAANLQAMNLEQEQLVELTNAAIGAWATYGDSIPIDGLAEAVNETVKAGQVTGTLADVLNWGSKEGETFGVTMKENTKANEEWNKAVEACTSAEDYFNLALSECNTAAERQQLVMDILAKQGLADAGKAWRENNKDIVAVNEATAEYDKAVAHLGETLAPVAAALLNFAADSINAVTGALKEGVQWCKDFVGWLNKANNAPNPTGKHRESGLSGSQAASMTYNAEADLQRQMKQGNATGRTTSARSGSDTSGGTETINITVQSTLDGRVIGESVTKYQKQQARADGR